MRVRRGTGSGRRRFGRLLGGMRAGRWWGLFRPRRPFPSRPWGCRPQTPAGALKGLVLKRRTGQGGGAWADHGPRLRGGARVRHLAQVRPEPRDRRRVARALDEVDVVEDEDTLVLDGGDVLQRAVRQQEPP